MISEIIKSTVQVTNGSVREIYEFCVNELNQQNGKNPYFSLLVYSNELLLRPFYDDIMSKWYNEQQNEKFMEFMSKRDQLILKHADRTNDGKIVYKSENTPSITENVVEFETDMNKLNEEYAEMIKDHASKVEANNKLLGEIQNIPIFNLKPELLPSDLNPRMVGYFASNIIKELFNV